MPTTAIIVAAGSGSRLGGPLPKQFLDLGGIPLLVRTVRAFDRSGVVDRILVAVPPEHVEHAMRHIVEPFTWSLRPELVVGGAERRDSVRRCLDLVPTGESELVLVHDGARPLVSTELLRLVADKVREVGAAVAAIPEKNTLKRVDDTGKVLETLDRRDLWEAQTPQGFRADWLRQAHEVPRPAADAVTDDAMLVEQLGYEVWIVPGDERNLKITTEFDLEVARWLVASGPARAQHEGSRTGVPVGSDPAPAAGSAHLEDRSC
ncbi:MAG: 2-C-methyl-D-erythritol 4-phosphate cytidylyltransferase [Candidatus Riflebacteria bacterium]|nr:2-C-methyl-D-erythritol 4-phosphate cytidylyltransferase [Candidatus Riflebacteria bacterium]